LNFFFVFSVPSNPHVELRIQAFPNFFHSFSDFVDFVRNICLSRNAFINRRARYTRYGNVNRILAECVCSGLVGRVECERATLSER
jgi:hypothetical protein